ncbi:MAG TPA: Na-translocating system protein MpsC family protein, partial [Gaiellaceae bacterium]|nr:Na-translocating system protein MpsC family protein [Gaiellaceae bacterium]
MKARTFLNESMVHVLLEDTMTTAERQLAADGEEEFVLDIRRRFQKTMHDDLVAAVEELGGRKVVA